MKTKLGLLFLIIALNSDQVNSESGYNSSLNKAEQYWTSADELHFVALGDWGSGRDGQKEVAEAMGAKCNYGLTHHHHHHHHSHKSSNCQFVMSVGDNIYPMGVKSERDEQFDTKWKDVYKHPAISKLNWFLTLGNHDHGNHEVKDNREQFQIKYSSIEPRWNLPDFAYSFRWTTKTTSATFVSIDTVSIDEDKNDPQEILDKLDHALQSADPSDWKIVFGHYPCWSGGNYDGIHSIRDKVLPILKKYNVDLYITGHDHNLQHWSSESGKGIDHFLVGAGGKSLYKYEKHHAKRNEKYGMKLHFFEDSYFGFGYFAISRDEITAQLIDAETGHPVYEFVRRKH